MIAWLRGKLGYISGEHLIIDVAGVGYAVTVSASVLATLPECGGEVSVIIYTDVKENDISLFGFSSHSEKEVFLLLKKVKGIGSKTAHATVSWMNPESILAAISRGDIGGLQKIPGVGRKTAERIVVELREEVGRIVEDIREPLSVTAGANGNVRKARSQDVTVTSDVVLALEKLGFSNERAQSAVRLTIESHRVERPEILGDAGELLRLALVNL